MTQIKPESVILSVVETVSWWRLRRYLTQPALHIKFKYKRTAILNLVYFWPVGF